MFNQILRDAFGGDTFGFQASLWSGVHTTLTRAFGGAYFTELEMEEAMKAVRRLTPAELHALRRAYRARSVAPLAVSDNASLCKQLAGIPGLGTMREHRVKAARVATPPPGWSDADRSTPEEAMELLDRATFSGTRDLLVLLVGGPGTGKSYSVDQITSLEHATPEMKWASTTATVAVSFSHPEASLVDRDGCANMWEEVVIRILFSHYYADTGLSFTSFRAALEKVVDTAGCDESTAISVLRCIVADVAAQGKTTVLLAVDELMRVHTMGKRAVATLLRVLAREMDTANRVAPRSMMLVVTSWSAAPLNVISPPQYGSSRVIASVTLPRLCGPSTVDLVLRAVSRPGDPGPTDALRSLVANLVAMCGGHPGTVETAWHALECRALAADPRQVSLPEVLTDAAKILVVKYKNLAGLTVPLVLAAWSGNALRSDHKFRVSVGGATDDTTVEELVEHGVLFATYTHYGRCYRPSLSIVQLLAWALSLKAPMDGIGVTAAADADRDIRSSVVDIIITAASDGFLSGNMLDHNIRVALQLRMVLLASDAPKPVTWRSLLNVAPLPEGSRPKLNDAALDRKFLLPKRRDISTKRPAYTAAEHKAAAWKPGEPLQARLKEESRQLKWLCPPPVTTMAFDLVMRCTEVVFVVTNTEEVLKEAGECVAFVQVKGLAGESERAWSRGHKASVRKACQRCRSAHHGKMVFIAAAYMDAPMPKTSLASHEAAAFILLNKQDCRRLMGTPLSMALEVSDRLARRNQGGERVRVRAGQGAGNPGAGSPP